MDTKVLAVASVAILALAVSDRPLAETQAQAQLSPRAAADAFLHRSEQLRVKYLYPDRPKQALDDLLAKRYDALESDLNWAEADFEGDPSYELAFY